MSKMSDEFIKLRQQQQADAYRAPRPPKVTATETTVSDGKGSIERDFIIVDEESSEKVLPEVLDIDKMIPTKTHIEQLANDRILKVKEQGGAIEFVARLAAFDTFSKTVREGLITTVRDELDKETGKARNFLGAKVEQAESGTSFDYSSDPVWSKLKAEEDEIALKRKEREGLLKGVKKKRVEVDEETGEARDLFPLPKKSKSNFKVTIAK